MLAVTILLRKLGLEKSRDLQRPICAVAQFTDETIQIMAHMKGSGARTCGILDLWNSTGGETTWWVADPRKLEFRL